MTDTSRGADRRRVVGIVMAGVVVGAASWFFGLSVPQALTVVAAVVAVGVTVVALGADESLWSLGWPVEPVRTMPGARKDVQSLGWALRSRGGVPERAILRLRTVARRRLGAIGLDLDDPLDRGPIESVVGAGTFEVLTRTTRPELDLGSFSALLDAVESIGTADTDAATPTATSAGRATATPASARRAGGADTIAGTPGTTERTP